MRETAVCTQTNLKPQRERRALSVVFQKSPVDLPLVGAVLRFSWPSGAVVGRFRIFPCCTERLVHYFGFFGATRSASRPFRDSYSLYSSSYSLFWIFWCYSVRLGCISRLLFIAPFDQFTIPDSLALHGFFLRTFGFLARIQRALPQGADRRSADDALRAHFLLTTFTLGRLVPDQGRSSCHRCSSAGTVSVNCFTAATA